jgi:Type I phosphodiesterase / nucleotide pyrophosphatase
MTASARCLALLVVAASLAIPAWAQSPKASLYVVLVLDGLRPDSINATDTPNLHRLRTEGVAFANSHSVFPTVTGVNAAAIGSGNYPDRNGIVGNNIYIPAVDAKHAFSNDDARLLLRLGDDIVTSPGLAEILQGAGERLVVVSSGSAGRALLVAPRSARGLGIIVHPGFHLLEEAGNLKEASAEAVKRFGPPPKKGSATEPNDESVNWAMNALDEYVLPELKPRVVVSWMTEPDHIQHARGPGSPEAIKSIRNDDAQIGKMLKKLESVGLRDRTDIMVVSDHGFSHTVGNVNVAQSLKDAGLMPAEESDDVVLASSGQAMAVHVKGHDPKKIAAIVEFLQQQPWCGVVFTSGKGGAPHEGSVAGTFSLEYVHLGGNERSADIVFTFPWSSATNRFGVRGADWSIVAKGSTGPVSVDAASHGGIGPWTVTNTMLAWGPDFKHGVVVRTPAANVDVAPTILYLLGLQRSSANMEGRALVEALIEGPDEEQVPMDTRALLVGKGSYRAVLQVTEVDGKRYVDKAWRQ